MTEPDPETFFETVQRLVRMRAEADLRRVLRTRWLMWVGVVTSTVSTAWNVWLGSAWFLVGICSLLMMAQVLRYSYQAQRNIEEALARLDEGRDPPTAAGD